MFRLYVDWPELAGRVFESHEDAMVEAKKLCTKPGDVVVITQDISEVRMAPVVSSLVPAAVPPATVYRGPIAPLAGEEEVLEARVPRATPRLLVVPDRRATPAEMVGHLMVVAEGKIVKNAFGALEIGDMPLTPAELAMIERGNPVKP